MTVVWIVVIAVVALVLERLFSSYIRKFGKRVSLPLHVVNNMVLSIRLLLLVGALSMIIGLAGVPMEWLVAISAILGSAIGFASNKTIGNFIAGFFLLTARPFRVGDYVKIGAVEGIVAEIAINYTKILTIDGNIVAMSNLQLLDRDITNYRLYEETVEEPLYRYNFEMGFNHSVSEAKMAEIFTEVLAEERDLPTPPTFVLDRTTVDGRFYKVFLQVSNPQIIFEKRRRIYERVMSRWDKARLGG